MDFEADRLAALRGYGVPGAAEERFDRITDLAAALFDAPIALVSLVDEHHQWFKSRRGLELDQTPRDQSFCAHALAMADDGVLVVEDAALDPRFSRNPLVTGAPGIRFYAGAPLITRDGFTLGTLCVIDTERRSRPSDEALRRLRALAQIVMDELELEKVSRGVEARTHLLRMAETMSGVGHWRYDLAKTTVTWSDEVYRIHGLDPAAFTPDFANVIGFYHPDDRPALEALVAKAVSEGAGYDCRARINRADGEPRHVIARAVCERDAAGVTTAIFGVFQDITEDVLALADRQRSELAAQEARALAEEKARRAAVAERVAGLGHWRVDFSDRKLSWSEQMYVIYGLDPATPLDVETVMALTHPDDRSITSGRLDDDLRHGPAEERPIIRIVRPDGSFRHVVGHTTVEHDPTGEVTAMVGTLMDVTRQHEAERILAESQARYRLLTENANDVVTEMSRTGLFTYVSPSVRTLIGYEPDEVIGQVAMDFIHPDDHPAVLAAFAGAADRPEGWTLEYRALCKDGRTIWVEARPSISRSDGDGAITDVIRDITQRKKMEAHLVAALAAAEAATAVKSEFLSNMSHELRTPLTSILGFCELLRGQTPEGGASALYVDRVSSAGQALLAIVNDILDFSKLEAGQVEIDRRPTAPAELAQSTLQLLAPQAGAKGLTLHFEGAALPARAMMDDTRVRQVLLNLIGNAVKFTDTGSVTVRVSHAQDTLRCEIVDTGPGVPADRLDRLFQRFSQVDASTTRSHGGTGLGLAICKGLVEAMGGRIGADSILGQGSTFWFELVCEPVEDDVLDASIPGLASDTGGDLCGLRLMVVDDNPMNRELVRLILTAADIEVTEAESGEQAVAIAAETPFDIILMDIRMPGLGGPASARLIRREPGPNDRTPILAFTADADDGTAAAQWGDVFNDRIDKPIVAGALFAALARWAPGGLDDRPLAAVAG